MRITTITEHTLTLTTTELRVLASALDAVEDGDIKQRIAWQMWRVLRDAGVRDINGRVVSREDSDELLALSEED